MMENLGLYTSKTIEKLVENNEYIEFEEGCLLDNFIFYSRKLKKYFLCMEYALNVWNSCYMVYSESGDGMNIFDKWYEFFGM